MNEEGGDLVLVCGDLAKDGKRSELETAKRVLDGLQMPYYPVLGNHDGLYSGEKEEALFKEDGVQGGESVNKMALPITRLLTVRRQEC